MNAQPISRAEFDAIAGRCCNWGRWGDADERGALNFIGADEVRAASRLVHSGRTVSCAWALDTVEGPDNPHPVRHSMTLNWSMRHDDGGDLRIAGDKFEMEIHGDAHSHLDALCHVGFEGRTYNGVDQHDSVNDRHALRQTVTVAAHGIITRGVLIDIPRHRGVEWVEPGEAIMPEEFLAAEEASGTTLRKGDLLLFRTGHSWRRTRLGPWDAATSKAGLHTTVLPILHERQIAGVGYDGDGEAVPSNCEGIAYPIHAISIPALGWWTMDSLNLDDLAATCAEEGRNEFMFTVAPLRLRHGTGSPVNPIAIF